MPMFTTSSLTMTDQVTSSLFASCPRARQLLSVSSAARFLSSRARTRSLHESRRLPRYARSPASATRPFVLRLLSLLQYAPINQLAVSAQCGFASTHHGNNVSLMLAAGMLTVLTSALSQLTIDEQWKKVALLQDIAKSINWDA